jgi:hypothetical protein
MPDHGRIGLRELRACIHDLNEGLLRLGRSIAHFEHARKIRLDVGELHRLEYVLRTEVVDALVACMEKSLGPEDRN